MEAYIDDKGLIIPFGYFSELLGFMLKTDVT
jgi:hypothetical protein